MAGGIASALALKKKEEDDAAATARSNVQAALEKKYRDQAAVETATSVSKSFGLGALEGVVSGILGLPGAVMDGLREDAAIKARMIGGRAPAMADSIPESPLPAPQEISAAMEDMTGLPLEAARRENPVVSAAGGGAASSLAFGLGLASKAGAIAKSGPRFMRNLAEYASENPVKFLAAETATGAGGGAAGGATAQHTDNPIAILGAEMAGSMATGGGLNIAKAAGRLTGLTPDSVTRPSAKTKAAEILQGEATDAEAALAALRGAETSPGTKHLTADLADDTGLQSFQKGQILGNKPLADESVEARLSTERSLRDQADAIGGYGAGGEAATNFVQDRVRKANARIDQRIDEARKSVRDEVAALRGPDIKRRELLNTSAKARLNEALEAERAVENQLWAAVPRSVTADMRNLKTFWDELGAAQSKTDRALGGKDLPGDITKLINDFDPYEPVDELVKLRSRILERIRSERGGDRPNARMIANLGKAQERILDMIEGSSELGEGVLRGEGLDALRDARGHTRALNEKFFRDNALSRHLGFNAQGGQKVADGLFLESLVENGPSGGISVDALTRAVPGDDILRMTEEFVERKFSEQALNPDGTVNLAKARRFIGGEGHGPALERLPGLRDRLAKVIDLAGRSEKSILYGEAQRKALNERSTASLYLHAEPRAVVRRILGSAEPMKEMDRNIALLKADESGAALQGFQRSFLDEMMGKMASSTGERGLRESGLNKVLDQYRPVMNKLYSKDQMRRLDAILKDVQRLGGVRGAQATRGSPTGENLSMLGHVLSRTVGAKVGRMVSSTIQVPQMAANMAEKIATSAKGRLVGELLEESVFDKELFEALLARPTPKNTPMIINRLRGHLYNAGIDTDDIEDEPEDAPSPGPQSSVTTSGLNFV